MQWRIYRDISLPAFKNRIKKISRWPFSNVKVLIGQNPDSNALPLSQCSTSRTRGGFKGSNNVFEGPEYGL